ncbi:50S ribosomal protein L3 N(5)-glutamine methyltransferase [Tibeticola sp.]|uniref:50S ribosomal protein L3 N(5)-glutamine methyltransferase n=1 Tax=Tibeticola sp. TaxID=2005368 RepID=UPI002586AA4D|nr:50S ribosomal protein L3 N(5)-glutamine methyltransferase [Tibeticola sp.]MCI4440193.1 50S ribosomal protein L3 N(5)-glutamine methyltransferase [Tibeticola sp.]
MKPALDATTVLELIEQAEQALIEAEVSFGHGTTNAFDEAAWLVLWRLGYALDRPLEGPEGIGADPVDAAAREAVLALLRERIERRVPAAYLTREAWLQGVPFYVDERSIVPRSLIAELISGGALEPWLREDTRSVLDLCTGNGSLAVLAALAYPEVQVVAADISSEALEVARINVARHRLHERIQVVASDGFSAVPGIFDLIVCNPPYVNEQSMAQLPAEYRAEPTLALAGGPDGMRFVRQLLREAPLHLAEYGVLVLEVGHERANFEAAFPGLEVVWLETSAGDDQVLLTTREAIEHAVLNGLNLSAAPTP